MKMSNLTSKLKVLKIELGEELLVHFHLSVTSKNIYIYIKKRKTKAALSKRKMHVVF